MEQIQSQIELWLHFFALVCYLIMIIYLHFDFMQ